MKFELSNKNQRNEPKHLKYEEINSGTGVLVVEWVEVEAAPTHYLLSPFLGSWHEFAKQISKTGILS